MSEKPKETTKRSIIKTATWRTTGSCVAATIAYLTTHDVTTMISMLSGTLIANTILYYFHERLWNKINWGYEKNI